MRIKVRGGTVRHDATSMCVTCCHSTIIRGQALNEEIVECHASAIHGRVIPFRVSSCTAYADSRMPSYMDMVRTAWILRPYSGKKRSAGFVRGEDLSDRELVQIASEARDRTR